LRVFAPMAVDWPRRLLTWLVPWEAAKLSSCWHGRTLGETRNQLAITVLASQRDEPAR
jgi:hypothetical protein